MPINVLCMSMSGVIGTGMEEMRSALIALNASMHVMHMGEHYEVAAVLSMSEIGLAGRQ